MRLCQSIAAGNTWAKQKDQPQLSVTGKRLSGSRDCLRDNDEQVFLLRIREAGRMPVKLLASKTGGDAAQICAPLEMHGSEEEDYGRHLVGCNKSARLTFKCTLLTVSHIASCSWQGKLMQQLPQGFCP